MRVVARRLNRLEYQNSVRDLLGVNVDFQEMLPPDGLADGIDNVGEALHVSSFLLERYLKNTQEQGESLLDRTMVFFSSNLGDASTHSTKNLPVLLAGGGFRHGQHLAFQPDNPPPLSNLYLSMLHRLGINADKFASSTGTLFGLET